MEDNNRTIALIGITVQQITDIHDPQRCLRVDLIRLCIGAAALLSDSVTIIEILIQPLRCYILLLVRELIDRFLAVSVAKEALTAISLYAELHLTGRIDKDRDFLHNLISMTVQNLQKLHNHHILLV